jgi:hypothetical protein
VTTYPEKLKVVWDWPPPKDRNMLRSIPGLCTYYWWFTARFADIAKPLSSSWKNLKKSLCTATILEYPRLSEKFNINTASNV